VPAHWSDRVDASRLLAAWASRSFRQLDYNFEGFLAVVLMLLPHRDCLGARAAGLVGAGELGHLLCGWAIQHSWLENGPGP
jgi:hypothetical protein